MIGNTFIGRSEMNFNSNKVQFIGNAMQYSQSIHHFRQEVLIQEQ